METRIPQPLQHKSLVNDTKRSNESGQLKKIVDNRPEAIRQMKMIDGMARYENSKKLGKYMVQRKVNYMDGYSDASKTCFNKGTRFFVTGAGYQDGMIVQNVNLKINKLIDGQNWIIERENYWEGWLVENGEVKIPIYNSDTGQMEHKSHDRINHDSFYYDISYAAGNVSFAKAEWETTIYWIGQDEVGQVLANMQMGGVITAGGLLSSRNDPTAGIAKEFVGSRYITSNELQKDDGLDVSDDLD